jgi:hypothetical protein
MLAKDQMPLIPCREGKPVGHGRFSLSGKGVGYIGKVVRGSISQSDTLGCLSPAVDSSQPTCISITYFSVMLNYEIGTNKEQTISIRIFILSNQMVYG